MCIRDIYQQNGIPGFWRGASASLYGLSETALLFILYEYYKKQFINTDRNHRFVICFLSKNGTAVRITLKHNFTFTPDL